MPLFATPWLFHDIAIFVYRQERKKKEMIRISTWQDDTYTEVPDARITSICGAIVAFCRDYDAVI